VCRVDAVLPSEAGVAVLDAREIEAFELSSDSEGGEFIAEPRAGAVVTGGAGAVDAESLECAEA